MSEDTLQLIAKVIAWVDGEDVDGIDLAATDVHFQDAAQQCAEDLGLA